VAHARYQIRAAVVSALTGLPTTGNNVFPAHKWPLFNTSVPALIVFTTTEDVQRVTHQPIEHLRSLQVEVIAKVKSATAEDDLDTICAEVEAALAADVTLGGKALDCRPLGTEIDLSIESEMKTGSATMRFEVQYSVREADPEVLL